MRRTGVSNSGRAARGIVRCRIRHGDPTVFFTRPISAGFLIATALFLAVMLATAIRKKREEVLEDQPAKA